MALGILGLGQGGLAGADPGRLPACQPEGVVGAEFQRSDRRAEGLVQSFTASLDALFEPGSLVLLVLGSDGIDCRQSWPNGSFALVDPGTDIVGFEDIAAKLAKALPVPAASLDRVQDGASHFARNGPCPDSQVWARAASDAKGLIEDMRTEYHFVGVQVTKNAPIVAIDRVTIPVTGDDLDLQHRNETAHIQC